MTLSTDRWRRGLLLLAVFGLTAVGASAQRTVTLRLNTATLPDTTKPTSRIEVRGCLDGCTGDQSALPGGQIIAWNANTTLVPTNTGGDYWQVQFQIPDNQKLSFKFFSQQAEAVSQIGGWEDGGNHEIAAGTGDVNLGLHYFEKGADQPYAWKPFATKQDTVAVHFRVYMATRRAFDNNFAATLPVAVRGGNFDPDDTGPLTGPGPLDWGANKLVLTRQSTDNTKPGYWLYAGTAYYAKTLAGRTQEYKFYFDAPSGKDGWESRTNRTFTVPTNDTTLAYVNFNDSPASSPNIPKATADVIFETDLSPLEAIGIYRRAAGDTIQVRGQFNGWDCGAAETDCKMTRVGGTSEYELQTTLVDQPLNAAINYKYYVKFNDANFRAAFAGRTPPSGWEEEINSSGTNRAFTFTGQNPQSIGLQFFDGILPANVIPHGTTINTTFRVDMRPALDNTLPQPFVPATDTVKIRFGDPIWLFTQGQPLRVDNGDLLDNSGYVMTDADGDRIYEVTIPVRGATIGQVNLGTYNGLQYTYRYGRPGAYIDDKSSVSTDAGTFGRRRTRFIVPTGSGWPANYTMTTAPEVFQFANAPLPYECNPAATGPYTNLRAPNCLPNGQATVGVEPVDGPSVTALRLDRAYPNPAAGAVRFRYALPSAGLVTLKVYDLMGREVASLVDGVQPASTYEVSYDGAGLASGVYVYRLTAGGQTLARTVVLAR